MSLSERLTSTPSSGQVSYALPSGWAPSVSYRPNGSAEVVTLGSGVPEESAWADEVRALGVHIPPHMTVRLVEIKHDPAAWVRHGQGEDAVTESVVRRRYVVEPSIAVADIDDLMASIGKRRPPLERPTGDSSFVIALSDWQIGKMAYGEGTDQTIARILEGLDRSITRLKYERKRRPIGEIVLAILGDMCEGNSSQGGAVLLSSDLGVTEQIRVIRRLLLEYVKELAPLAEKVLIPVAPGNHDQPHRFGGIAPRADDSWAVDVACQVADALDLAGGYDHVRVFTPKTDELTVVVETSNTIIGCTHGHSFKKGKGHEWWAKQNHARQPVGAADILLTGHFHHLRIEVDADRTWIQAPTVDPGSPHYDQRSGGRAKAGLLTFLAADGSWWGLEA